MPKREKTVGALGPIWTPNFEGVRQDGVRQDGPDSPRQLQMIRARTRRSRKIFRLCSTISPEPNRRLTKWVVKGAASRLVSWSPITTTSSAKGSAQREWTKLLFGRVQVGHVQVAGGGRLAKGGSPWRWRDDRAMMLNRRTNTQGQIQGQFAQGQFARQILESGFKIADLVRGSKRRFGLVVRLIANEYYVDLFRYLSFLPPAIGPPSFAVQTFDLSLTSDRSSGSIGDSVRFAGSSIWPRAI